MVSAAYRRPKAEATERWKQALRFHVKFDNEPDPPDYPTALRRYADALAHAESQWRARGFSMVPLRPGTKAPYQGFQRFCARHRTKDDLLCWTHKEQFGGLAFANGPASATKPGLEFVTLDLDADDIAERWKEQAGDLSDCIQSRGAKGLHVHFFAPTDRLPVGSVVPLMLIDGRSVGELRMRNAVTAAPPTLHPNMTPARTIEYREIDPRPFAMLAGIAAPKLRIVDDLAAFLGEEICEGLRIHAARADVRQLAGGTAVPVAVPSFAEELDRLRESALPMPEPKRPAAAQKIASKADPVELATRSCLSESDRRWAIDFATPQAIGERNRHSFLLVRHWKAMRDFDDFKRLLLNSPKYAIQVAGEFWDAQDPAIRKPFDVVRDELLYALPRVKVPLGSDSLGVLIAESQRIPEPPCLPALVKELRLAGDDVKILRLAHVLQAYHRRRGSERFFIAQAEVGRLLGVSQPMARRRLLALQALRIIDRPVQGSRSKGASEYVLRCGCFAKTEDSGHADRDGIRGCGGPMVAVPAPVNVAPVGSVAGR